MAALIRPILAIGTPLSLILVLAALPLALPLALPIIFLVLLILLVALVLVLTLVLLALLVLLVRHTPQLLYSPSVQLAPIAEREEGKARTTSSGGGSRVSRLERFDRMRLGSCHETMSGVGMDHDDDAVSTFTVNKQFSSPAFGIDSPRKR